MCPSLRLVERFIFKIPAPDTVCLRALNCLWEEYAIPETAGALGHILLFIRAYFFVTDRKWIGKGQRSVYTALLLEDSQTQAQVIGKMLEAAGWSFQHFPSVREATEALTMMRYDALLLDVFVGQHNTLLHLERFRKLAPGATITLMSAGQGGDIQTTLAAARRAGADFILPKPFSPATLKGVLSDVEGRIDGTRRRHVLVIDDSKTVRHFAANAFLCGNYKVSQADSMEAAFNDIDIAHVDLVLCDVFMPGMGGVEGIATIKATWPNVKIISMSAGFEGRVTDTDALQATRLVGADAQLQKPFTHAQVLNAARQLVG